MLRTRQCCGRQKECAPGAPMAALQTSSVSGSVVCASRGRAGAGRAAMRSLEATPAALCMCRRHGAGHDLRTLPPLSNSPHIPQRHAVVSVVNEVNHGGDGQRQGHQGKDDSIGARPNELFACGGGKRRTGQGGSEWGPAGRLQLCQACSGSSGQGRAHEKEGQGGRPCSAGAVQVGGGSAPPAARSLRGEA